MGVGVTMPTHVGVGQNTGLARSRSRNPSRNQSQNQSRSSSRNRSRVRSHSPSLNQSGIQSRSRSKPSGHSRTPQSKLQPRRTQRADRSPDDVSVHKPKPSKPPIFHLPWKGRPVAQTSHFLAPQKGTNSLRIILGPGNT